LLVGEGVSTLRNLLGTLLIEGISQGIVVSTADHFTYQAYKAANKAESKGYLIKLIDRGKLDRMLSPFLPKNPWKSALEQYEWGIDISLNLEDKLKTIKF